MTIHRPIFSFPVVRRLAGATALGFLLAVTAAAPAAAQNDLSRELELLKRDLKDLQRYIYRGEGTPPASSGTSGASGDTASPEASQPLPSDIAGRLQIKMQRLESDMRTLTGRVEEVEFRVRQVDQRLEKFVSDVDFRLQQLEQGGPVADAGASGQAGSPQALGPSASGSGASSSGEAGAGDAGAGDAGASASEEPGTTVISSAGATQESEGGGASASGDSASSSSGQTLGTLRTNSEGEIVGADLAPQQSDPQSQTQAQAQSQSQPQQQASAAPATPEVPPQPGAVSGAETTATAPSGALPDGTVQEQYEFAFSLLRKRDFDAAEGAMRRFVNANGDHELAGNAMYWLGETYYARGNYRDAAATFLDAYTGYPKNDKASHSLLKLAMSLGALGKKDAACQAFDTLRQEGEASQRILSTAEAEAAKLGC